METRGYLYCSFGQLGPKGETLGEAPCPRCFDEAGSAIMAWDAIEKSFEKLLEQGAATKAEMLAMTAPAPAETQEGMFEPSQEVGPSPLQMNLL